jgi:hypothetical protein
MLRPTSSPESMRLGLGGDTLGDTVGSDPEEVSAGPGLRRRGLKKSEHCRHQGSHAHLLGL